MVPESREAAIGKDDGMTPQRTTPPFEADERTTVSAFLDFQRATLALKCEGLTEAQLKELAVPPSSLSLLGIVRHMAEVERNWFRPVLGGEPMATIFAPDMDWEAAFRDVATAAPSSQGGPRQPRDHAGPLAARPAVAPGAPTWLLGNLGGQQVLGPSR